MSKFLSNPSSKQIASIKKLLDHYKTFFRVEGETIYLTKGLSVEHRHYEHMIASELGIIGRIEEGLALQVTAETLRKGLLSSNLNAQDLIKELNSEIYLIEGRKEIEYIVISSLGLPFSNKLVNTLSINNCKISVKINSYDHSKVEAEIEKAANQHDIKFPDFYQKIQVKVRGTAPNLAVDKAISTLDQLRGLISLSDYTINPRWHLSHSISSPNIYNIPLAIAHVVLDKNYQPLTPCLYYSDQHSNDPIRVNAIKNWDSVRKYVERTSDKLSQDKLGQQVLECLARYAYAVDEDNPAHAIIILWGIMETLTGSKTQDEVIKRLSFLFIDPGTVKTELHFLVNFRNRAAHSWFESSRRYDIYQNTKGYVEALFRFRINSTQFFKNIQEIGQFLDQSVDDNAAERMISISKAALQFRKTGKFNLVSN